MEISHLNFLSQLLWGKQCTVYAHSQSGGFALNYQENTQVRLYYYNNLKTTVKADKSDFSSAEPGRSYIHLFMPSGIILSLSSEMKSSRAVGTSLLL